MIFQSRENKFNKQHSTIFVCPPHSSTHLIFILTSYAPFSPVYNPTTANPLSQCLSLIFSEKHFSSYRIRSNGHAEIGSSVMGIRVKIRVNGLCCNQQYQFWIKKSEPQRLTDLKLDSKTLERYKVMNWTQDHCQM